jgi:hypothetical protein
VAAALVTVTLWASAFVGIRAVVDDFARVAGLGRLTVRVDRAGRRRYGPRAGRPSRRDLALIIASGLLWLPVTTSR